MKLNLKDIKNWIEKDRGHYRIVTACDVCYEIFIDHYYGDIDKPSNDFLTAQASVCCTGIWNTNNITYPELFKRDYLLEHQPLFECLEKAQEDYEKMEKENEQEEKK